MKIAVCTTINSEGYNQYAKENFESFVKYWPSDIKLHAFMEGEFEKVPGVNYYDFLQVQPDLVAFLKRNEGRKWFPADREMKIYKRNWKKFCWKVFAQYTASKLVDADYLIWLDADIVTKKILPKKVIEQYIKSDKFVSFLNRENNPRNKKMVKRKWLSTESGFIIYNLKHPMSDEFFERYIDYYRKDTLFDLFEVADNYVFDVLVSQMEQERKIECNRLTDGVSESPLKILELGDYLFHVMGRKKWVKDYNPEDYKNL